jgi:hypothetical protein
VPPEPSEEPQIANDPPEVAAAFQSVTEDDPWAKAEALLESGLTVQQASPLPSHDHLP